MMSLLQDFGIELSATVHTDASAEIGILRRKGIGKIRRLNVRYLWLQDKIRTGAKLAIAKVPGLEIPAEVVTKYLNRRPREGTSTSSTMDPYKDLHGSLYDPIWVTIWIHISQQSLNFLWKT